MSFKCIFETALSSPEEVFFELRCQLCNLVGKRNYALDGLGYQLIDESFVTGPEAPEVGDWFVIRSDGEDENEAFFFRFIYDEEYGSTKKLLGIEAYLGWNSTTHVGSDRSASIYARSTIPASKSKLTLAGDKDSVVVVITDFLEKGTEMMSFGRLYEEFSPTIGRSSTSSIVEGADQVIELDEEVPEFVVGKTVAVHDSNDYATFTITAVSGTTLTGDAVGASLSPDLVVSDVSPVCLFSFGDSVASNTLRLLYSVSNVITANALFNQAGFDASDDALLLLRFTTTAGAVKHLRYDTLTDLAFLSRRDRRSVRLRSDAAKRYRLYKIAQSANYLYYVREK